jgi:hypothetical protein
MVLGVKDRNEKPAAQRGLAMDSLVRRGAHAQILLLLPYILKPH